MTSKKKIKYEKPTSVDIGAIAPVLGTVCSNGSGASGGCGIGDNPDVEPFCQSTGNNADGNCETNGNIAGKACYSTGGTAGWGCTNPSGGKKIEHVNRFG